MKGLTEERLRFIRAACQEHCVFCPDVDICTNLPDIPPDATRDIEEKILKKFEDNLRENTLCGFLSKLMDEANKDEI